MVLRRVALVGWDVAEASLGRVAIVRPTQPKTCPKVVPSVSIRSVRPRPSRIAKRIPNPATRDGMRRVILKG